MNKFRWNFCILKVKSWS